MNIALLYATYSGGTASACETIQQTIAETNNTVTYKPVADCKPDEITGFDLVIMATPTWDYNGKEGQPHEDFVVFMEKVKSQNLSGKKFAIMGLGDSSYAHFCGSVDVLEEFVKEIHGVLAVPSLKIDGYFYDQAKHTEDIRTWSKSLVG